jgi:hypothetical protein
VKHHGATLERFNVLLFTDAHHCSPMSISILCTLSFATMLPMKSVCDAILPQFAHFHLTLDTCRERISVSGRRRKNQASTGSIRTARETSAQFLVIGLWIAVHVEASKGDKVTFFLMDFKTRESKRVP